MRALLIILICLGVVLAALAFFADVKMPVHVHTASSVSDGTTTGTRVTSSHDMTIEKSANWMVWVGLALDIAAIIIVAVRLWRKMPPQ
jgi:hypothetical protein